MLQIFQDRKFFYLHKLYWLQPNSVDQNVEYNFTSVKWRKLFYFRRCIHLKKAEPIGTKEEGLLVGFVVKLAHNQLVANTLDSSFNLLVTSKLFKTPWCSPITLKYSDTVWASWILVFFLTVIVKSENRVVHLNLNSWIGTNSTMFQLIYQLGSLGWSRLLSSAYANFSFRSLKSSRPTATRIRFGGTLWLSAKSNSW